MQQDEYVMEILRNPPFKSLKGIAPHAHSLSKENNNPRLFPFVPFLLKKTAQEVCTKN